VHRVLNLDVLLQKIVTGLRDILDDTWRKDAVGMGGFELQWEGRRGGIEITTVEEARIYMIN